MLTNSGVTAIFSSPSAEPGGFAVRPTFLPGFTGQILASPGPSAVNNIPLDIAFSQPVKSISLVFALNTGDPAVPLHLDAFLGAGLVGNASATGTIPPSASFPEGSIAFSGTSFDRVVPSTGALNFAVDDIVVETADIPPGVPEPSTILGASFAMLAGLGIRRRCRRPGH